MNIHVYIYMCVKYMHVKTSVYIYVYIYHLHMICIHAEFSCMHGSIVQTAISSLNDINAIVVNARFSPLKDGTPSLSFPVRLPF